MIVGTRTIPLDKLREASGSVKSLIEFSNNLVPKPIRHVDAVVSNQRYLVALYLRKIKSLPYKKTVELCNGLLEGVVIKGVVNEVYDLEDLLRATDTDKLYRFLFER
jgi:hypothetical protein